MKTTVFSYRIMRECSVRKYLPPRNRDAHKGMFGRILLLCGSVGYTGAAKLAAQAACRAGAGLVYLGVPEPIYPIVAPALSEPIVLPLPAENGGFSAKAIPEVAKLLPRMDAVLCGPGIGNGAGAAVLTQWLVENCTVPLLLDADGINAFKGREELLLKHKGPLVLTPHDGEFARVYHGTPLGRTKEAEYFAKEYSCILLRKGHRTLITDGITTYRNETGNPGMAKGGSGDVLSGIAVALLGRNIPPLQAVALAAWLHGKAGDGCARKLGEEGMLPSDMIAELPMLTK